MESLSAEVRVITQADGARGLLGARIDMVHRVCEEDARYVWLNAIRLAQEGEDQSGEPPREDGTRDERGVIGEGDHQERVRGQGVAVARAEVPEANQSLA